MKKLFLSLVAASLLSFAIPSKADWPDVYGWAFEGVGCTGLAYETYSFSDMLWQITKNNMQSFSFSFGEPRCHNTSSLTKEALITA